MWSSVVAPCLPDGCPLLASARSRSRSTAMHDGRVAPHPPRLPASDQLKARGGSRRSKVKAASLRPTYRRDYRAYRRDEPPWLAASAGQRTRRIDLLLLTLLAPGIVKAILDGRQPEAMTLPGLLDSVPAAAIAAILGLQPRLACPACLHRIDAGGTFLHAGFRGGPWRHIAVDMPHLAVRLAIIIGSALSGTGGEALAQRGQGGSAGPERRSRRERYRPYGRGSCHDERYSHSLATDPDAFTFFALAAIGVNLGAVRGAPRMRSRSASSAATAM